MRKRHFGRHRHEAPRHERVQDNARPPYWMRAHRNRWFWVGLVLMLTALTIYIVSDDLAFLPGGQPRHSMPVAVGE